MHTGKEKGWIKFAERGHDGTDRTGACYLGEFLRMDDPEMDKIPSGIVDLQMLKISPAYLCYEHKINEHVGKDDLKPVHQEYAKFEISHLVHNTSLDNFLDILSDEIIKPGGEKKIETIGKYKFSWWGLSVGKQEKDNYLSAMKGLIKGTRGTSAMLHTGPFCNTSRYGNFRIKLPVEKLFEYYRTSLGRDYHKRILWTTAYYQQEIMHTILIHPNDEKFEKEFGHLPKMEDYMADKKDSYAVVTTVDGKWIWCPQTTSLIHPDTTKDEIKFKSWDHLTFAFLIPDGCKGICVPKEDLTQNLFFQRIGDTNLSPDEGYKHVFDAIIALLERAPQKLTREKEKSLLLFKQIPEAIDNLPKKEIAKKNIAVVAENLEKIILVSYKDAIDEFAEILLKIKPKKRAKDNKSEAKADNGEQSCKSTKGASEGDKPEKEAKKSRKRRGKGTKDLSVDKSKQKIKSKRSRKRGENCAEELAVENEPKQDEIELENKTNEPEGEDLQNQNLKECEKKAKNQESCDP